MLPSSERRKAQRELDATNVESASHNSAERALQSQVALSLNPTFSPAGVPLAQDNFSPSPSHVKELMFSNLPAQTLYTDKLYVYDQECAFDRESWHQKYEYVMVFAMMGPEQSLWKSNLPAEIPHRARDIVDRLHSVGIEVYPYLSIQKDELILLITCPSSTLMHFTDKIDYLMELDPAYTREVLSLGSKEHSIRPIKITDDPQYSSIHPFEHIFGKYESFLDPKIYLTKPGNVSAFDRMTRLKILHYMLTMPRSLGGCGISLTKLLLSKEMLAFFPPHSEAEISGILKVSQSACTMPWHQPYGAIRDYMGEKVALYYVFVGHYSMWLVVPALLGLAFELLVWGTGPNFSHPVLPFYGLAITVWAIAMLEYWKRTQATTSMRWGMLDFEKEEPVRPEFRGALIKSYVDGGDVLYYPPSVKMRLLAFSQTVIVTFVCTVIGVVAGIYYMRYVLQTQSLGPYASPVASVVNTIQITLFNLLYEHVAIYLTNHENHRTDTMFQDSLIVKIFLFQFVNSYASFFFIAFIAGNLTPTPGQDPSFLGQCGWTNCMQPLSVNLAIIFGSRLTVTNALDILVPLLTLLAKRQRETLGKDVAALTPPERDYVLMEADILLDSIQCFADTAIQFGFTVLFITALPVATFFSLLSNYLKVKLQSYKLLRLYQRPVPQGCQDIGTWQDIFKIISVVSVVTNAAIICFTMDVLNYDNDTLNARITQLGGLSARANFSLVGRLWVFFGFCATLGLFQFLLTLAIPDVPLEVQIQHERQAFIVSKAIQRLADEDYSELAHQMDMADDAEANAPAEPHELSPEGCCCCQLPTTAAVRGRGKVRLNVDHLADQPLPLYEYPEALSDAKPNFKRKDA